MISKEKVLELFTNKDKFFELFEIENSKEEKVFYLNNIFEYNKKKIKSDESFIDRLVIFLNELEKNGKSIGMSKQYNIERDIFLENIHVYYLSPSGVNIKALEEDEWHLTNNYFKGKEIEIVNEKLSALNSLKNLIKKSFGIKYIFDIAAITHNEMMFFYEDMKNNNGKVKIKDVDSHEYLMKYYSSFMENKNILNYKVGEGTYKNLFVFIRMILDNRNDNIDENSKFLDYVIEDVIKNNWDGAHKELNIICCNNVLKNTNQLNINYNKSFVKKACNLIINKEEDLLNDIYTSTNYPDCYNETFEPSLIMLSYIKNKMEKYGNDWFQPKIYNKEDKILLVLKNYRGLTTIDSFIKDMNTEDYGVNFLWDTQGKMSVSEQRIEIYEDENGLNIMLKKEDVSSLNLDNLIDCIRGGFGDYIDLKKSSKFELDYNDLTSNMLKRIREISLNNSISNNKVKINTKNKI